MAHVADVGVLPSRDSEDPVSMAAMRMRERTIRKLPPPMLDELASYHGGDVLLVRECVACVRFARECEEALVLQHGRAAAGLPA